MLKASPELKRPSKAADLNFEIVVEIWILTKRDALWSPVFFTNMHFGRRACDVRGDGLSEQMFTETSCKFEALWPGFKGEPFSFIVSILSKIFDMSVDISVDISASYYNILESYVRREKNSDVRGGGVISGKLNFEGATKTSMNT
jgi:hypothetical protein